MLLIATDMVVARVKVLNTNQAVAAMSCKGRDQHPCDQTLMRVGPLSVAGE